MSESIENISVDLIDDPAVPIRTQMDEQKLSELAASIKKHGLIQPVTLRRVENRYEVVAGHRRLKAAKLANVPTVAAVVKELDDRRAEELKVHENLFREDMNPVDEAQHIVHMIDTYGMSPKEMSELTGKSESYLRARYELLQYPDYLVDAVGSGDIGLTAAQWLAKIDNDVIRRDYTRFARLGGITAKRAQAWYQSWSAGNLPREPEAYAEPEPESSGEPIPIEEPCSICGFVDNIDNLRMVYAHEDCRKALQDVNRQQPQNE